MTSPSLSPQHVFPEGCRVQLSYCGAFGSVVRRIAKDLYEVRLDRGDTFPCIGDVLRDAVIPDILPRGVIRFASRREALRHHGERA